MAFYDKGDDMYEWLNSLFITGVEKQTDVITISSDGPYVGGVNNTAFPFLIPDSDGEQEVESPVVSGRKPPRKQLFTDDGSGSSRALVSIESYSASDKKVVKLKRDFKSLFGNCFDRNAAMPLVGGGSLNIVKKETFETLFKPVQVGRLNPCKEVKSAAFCSLTFYTHIM